MTYKIIKTLNPKSEEINLLTQKLNEESQKEGVTAKAFPFAFYIKDENGQLIGGCNGAVIFGSIYTDQLWVSANYRKQGMGRKLMDKVHQLGREESCKMATVSTMDFQNAIQFYKKLGYNSCYIREGYHNEAKCFFLEKKLDAL